MNDLKSTINFNKETLPKRKVLILDDLDVDDKIIILKGFGYDISHCRDIEAANKVLIEDSSFHIVFIDENLGAGSPTTGTEFAKWMTEQKEYANIPLVMFTANSAKDVDFAVASLTLNGFSYFINKDNFDGKNKIKEYLEIIEKIPSVKRKRENALLKQSLQGTVSTWVDFKASLDITFPNEGYTLYQELRLRIIDKIIQIQRARTIEEVSVLFHYFETECDKEYTRLTRLRLNNPNVVSTKIINFRSTRGVQVTQAKVNLCQQYKQDLTNFIDNFTVPHEIQKQWDSDFMYANDKHNQPKSYNTLKGYYSERIHEFHNVVLKIMFDNPLLFKNFERIREFQRWSSIKDAFVSKAQFESTYQEAKGNP